ncbi:MAG: hypothetical protein R2854_16740 [Caldilineaceae bacterium]
MPTSISTFLEVGPTGLEKFVPVQVAGLIERLFIYVLPIAVLLFPLLRSTPLAYRFANLISHLPLVHPGARSRSGTSIGLRGRNLTMRSTTWRNWTGVSLTACAHAGLLPTRFLRPAHAPASCARSTRERRPNWPTATTVTK